MWQQAAGEGVSVFVASGDNAAAGCDDFDTASFATTGIAANALASTPYNVATGGTDFLDTAEGSLSTYWSTTNDSVREISEILHSRDALEPILREQRADQLPWSE